MSFFISFELPRFGNLIIILILLMRKQKSREDSGLLVMEPEQISGLFLPVQMIGIQHHAEWIIQIVPEHILCVW